MQHCIVFSRKQGIDGEAAGIRQFLEAPPFQFMRDEDGTLFRRQFAQRHIQFFQQDPSRVIRLRPRFRAMPSLAYQPEV